MASTAYLYAKNNTVPVMLITVNNLDDDNVLLSMREYFISKLLNDVLYVPCCISIEVTKETR